MNTAHARLKAAYAANNIIWDDTLVALPDDTANELAAHWEGRAAGSAPAEPARPVVDIHRFVTEFVKRHGCGFAGLSSSTQDYRTAPPAS